MDIKSPRIAERRPIRRRVFWCKVPVLDTVVLHHDVADDVWRMVQIVDDLRELAGEEERTGY